AKTTVDLKKMGERNLSIGTFFIGIIGHTKEDMLIDISSLRIDEGLLVFLKNDLSSHLTVKDDTTDLETAYSSGELDPYASLFQPLDATEEYEILSNNYESFIFNKQQEKIIDLHSGDELSQDGKWVYINGESPKEGTQQFQKTEDYLTNQGEITKEIVIDGRASAKIAKLKRAVELTDIKLIYFREGFLVYSLIYSTENDYDERTNILIDLNQENPTPYLFRLG